MRILLPALAAAMIGMPLGAQAAVFYFGAPSQEVSVHKLFEVGVFVNTEGENASGVQGEIIFAKDLELREVRDGASIIPFWLERPSAAGSRVAFSGIVPGGYSGTQGFLFSFVVRSQRLGKITVDAENVRMLRNDAEGSSLNVKVAPLVLHIVERAASAEFSAPLDADPPEEFVPEISRDPDLFGGKRFLVFAAQDKGSGIDRYEVREGERPFAVAQSPYLLGNQNLNEEIAVRAVDRSGNERLAVIPARGFRPGLETLALSGILLLAAGVGYMIRKRWRRKA